MRTGETGQVLKADTDMKKYLLAACAVSALGGAAQSAFAANADWKEYGGLGTGAILSNCFFDHRSINRTSDGHVRVWTKCIAASDMAVDAKTARGKKLFDAGAVQMLKGYVPPIVSVGVVKGSEDAILREQVADLNDTEPTAKVFTEIDCPNQLARRLDTYIKSTTQIYSIDQPGDWRYIAPETPIRNLYRILCEAPSHE